MLKTGVADWVEMQAEIVAAEVKKSGSKYQVAVQYTYIQDGTRQTAEYLSCEMACEADAQAYAEFSLKRYGP
jgi:hypothetical protein